MNKIRLTLFAMVVAGLLAPALPSEAAAPKPLKLSISNFRYCRTASCTPLDVGYLRSSSGPVSGTDNSNAVVPVRRGATVIWVYRDGSCDDFGCPGHNIYFENGSPAGAKKGFVPSGQGEKTIKVKITQKPGTTIRYFCTVNNHYETGMTGILRVTP